MSDQHQDPSHHRVNNEARPTKECFYSPLDRVRGQRRDVRDIPMAQFRATAYAIERVRNVAAEASEAWPAINVAAWPCRTSGKLWLANDLTLEEACAAYSYSAFASGLATRGHLGKASCTGTGGQSLMGDRMPPGRGAQQ